MRKTADSNGDPVPTDSDAASAWPAAGRGSELEVGDGSNEPKRETATAMPVLAADAELVGCTGELTVDM